VQVHHRTQNNIASWSFHPYIHTFFYGVKKGNARPVYKFFYEKKPWKKVMHVKKKICIIMRENVAEKKN